MADTRVVFKRVLILILLLVAALMYHQYSLYIERRDRIVQADVENLRALAKIDSVLKREQEFSSDLAALTERHEQLRQQLPTQMGLDDFKQELATLYAKYDIEVLAQRDAPHYRSLYKEMRLSYSLKASMRHVEQVMNELKKRPRLVLSNGPQRQSLKNIGLTLSIFSVPEEVQINIKIPKCMSRTENLFIPYLRQELEPVYNDYIQTCQTLVLEQNSALYQDIQRYQQLQEDVQRLETIRNTLREGK
jgi:hypothetical protein